MQKPLCLSKKYSPHKDEKGIKITAKVELAYIASPREARIDLATRRNERSTWRTVFARGKIEKDSIAFHKKFNLVLMNMK